MDIQVLVTGGPNEMQLQASLMRQSRSRNPYGIDIDKATSVQFTVFSEKYKSLGLPDVPEVTAVINGMIREDGSGTSWILQGYILNSPNCNFSGYYSSQFRKGHFTFKS